MGAMKQASGQCVEARGRRAFTMTPMRRSAEAISCGQEAIPGAPAREAPCRPCVLASVLDVGQPVESLGIPVDTKYQTAATMSTFVFFWSQARQ